MRMKTSEIETSEFETEQGKPLALSLYGLTGRIFLN